MSQPTCPHGFYEDCCIDCLRYEIERLRATAKPPTWTPEAISRAADAMVDSWGGSPLSSQCPCTYRPDYPYLQAWREKFASLLRLVQPILCGPEPAEPKEKPT